MKKELLILGLGASLAWAGRLSSQAQLEVIPRPNSAFTNTAQADSLLGGKVDKNLLDSVWAFISRKDASLKGSEYAIMHVAQWEKNRKILKQKWYVHRTTEIPGVWLPKEINGTRIYGSAKIAFIGLHYQTPADLSYRIEIASKESAPLQSARALLELAAPMMVMAPTLDSAVTPWMWTARAIDVQHVPSDIVARMMLPVKAAQPDGDEAEVAKQTFDNEGLYRWDFSVGLPVTSLHQLEYNAADGTVRTTEVDKQNLLAFVNFHFVRVDTKQVRRKLTPSLLVGVSIDSRPLDRLVVALATGLTVAQVFVGASFDRVKEPSSLTLGQNSTEAQLKQDLRAKYKPQLIVGVNAPVRQVIDRLNPKK